MVYVRDLKQHYIWEVILAVLLSTNSVFQLFQHSNQANQFNIHLKTKEIGKN